MHRWLVLRKKQRVITAGMFLLLIMFYLRLHESGFTKKLRFLEYKDGARNFTGRVENEGNYLCTLPPKIGYWPLLAPSFHGVCHYSIQKEPFNGWLITILMGSMHALHRSTAPRNKLVLRSTEMGFGGIIIFLDMWNSFRTK